MITDHIKYAPANEIFTGDVFFWSDPKGVMRGFDDAVREPVVFSVFVQSEIKKFEAIVCRLENDEIFTQAATNIFNTMFDEKLLNSELVKEMKKVIQCLKKALKEHEDELELTANYREELPSPDFFRILFKQNEQMRKTLEKYADFDNNIYGENYGGKLARECLKSLNSSTSS